MSDSSGNDVVASLRVAMDLHREGRLEEADTEYAEVLATAPQHRQALRLRGVLARQLGDPISSLELLQAAVESAPGDPTPLNELALTCMSSGDLPAAEAALRDVLDIDPGSTRALANLGALLQRTGYLIEAVGLYRRYLKYETDDLEVRCNLANALMDAGRGDDALSECAAALTCAPGHPLLLASQGAVLCGLERFVPAIDVLQSALVINPNDDLALLNLGYAQRAIGDRNAALDTLTRAARLSPDNARACADLANLLLAIGKTDRAVEACEHFLGIHPGERLVVATYAFALRDAGRTAEADKLTDFERLVRIVDIEPPAGYTDLSTFNADLARCITSHPSLVPDPVRKATMGGAQTGELDGAEERAIVALIGVIDQAVSDANEAYAERVDLEDHPIRNGATGSWALRTWGTVLRGGGYQSPHLHPLGWLSGVYYVSLPEAVRSAMGAAGSLEFGRPPERIQPAADPVTRSVVPREGRLVIFPSWFYHRTVPFESNDQRVSIAFDAIPKIL